MLQLIRVYEGKNSTLSHLYIDQLFFCYILEDSIRTLKLAGRTCIPNGIYEMTLNVDAGMNLNYRNKIGKNHYGMVEICGVPNFSMVFFHIGNTHLDTKGCLLTGEYFRIENEDYQVLQSAQAYKRLYRKLSSLIKQRKTCLEVINSCMHSGL